ncbi:MAG: 3-isopropylmalate dehydratase small subunit [Chloroflexi bacterium]|nr:3-isopropylmalate dehydratase small subunit [Chloroflexota bacterium]
MQPFTTLHSRLLPLPQENVDTDQIIPARYLKGTDKTGLAEGLFADWRRDGQGRQRPDFPLNRPEHQGAQILLAGDNFACGSSREHAPWALLAGGFRAVISTSFADIFRNNALKNGLLPLTLPPQEHQALFALVAAQPDAEVLIDLAAQTVALPDGRRFAFSLDPFARDCLLHGVDELGYLLGLESRIAAYEAAHPAPVRTTPPA